MENALKINNQYESIEFTTVAVQTQGKGKIKLLGKLDNNEYTCIKQINKQNTITKINGYSVVTYKLVSTLPFSYTIYGEDIPLYYNKQKIEDFLYEITYSTLDYDYAKQNFIIQSLPSGCSSIRNGNWFGRNFDWYYNNDIQLIIHTPQTLNYHAVLGVTGAVPGVNKTSIEQNTITVDGTNMYKTLPFYLVDGINECGLFCSENLVPLDNDVTVEVVAIKEERDRIPVPMLVRYVLDRFSNAKKAIDYIKNYVTLYFPDDMITNWKKQCHFLIGDRLNTYVLEFINGKLEVLPYKYITNFQLHGVIFNKDMSINKPYIPNGVNKFGNGLERWQLINEDYKLSNTKNGMTNLLDTIKYSNGYNEDESKFWYSEITGMVDDSLVDKITVDTDPDFCSTSFGETMEAWDLKDRDDPKVFITCHSSIYDINKKQLFIRNQEGEPEYTFSL